MIQLNCPLLISLVFRVTLFLASFFFQVLWVELVSVYLFLNTSLKSVWLFLTFSKLIAALITFSGHYFNPDTLKELECRAGTHMS